MPEQHSPGLQTVQFEQGSALNVMALCAGVGGLELGLELALDFLGKRSRLVVAVEREAAAVGSLVASMEAGWFHKAPIWSDLSTFDGAAWRGCVDIVTSGDPCQGNSVAGKRLGQLDDRWLLDRAVEIFDASGARYFFRENVPGNADGQLAVAIPALERLGCRVASGIFSSAETGNTMRRERLFILAVRESDPRRIHPRSGRSEQSAPDPRGDGRELGGTEIKRRGTRRAEHARQQGGYSPASAGSELASPGSAGSQGQQRWQHHPEGWQVKGGHAGLHGGAILPPAIIPGPGDSRWIDLLDRFPEYQPALSQEEAESHLRRGVDAMANRIERLRATGNGVDPVVAAYAFLRLGARLGLWAD